MHSLLITWVTFGLIRLSVAPPPGLAVEEGGRVVAVLLTTTPSVISTTTSITTSSAITTKALSTTTTTFAVCTIPSSACTSPGPQTTYLPEPCFPNTGVCYPTSYYAAQDQGQLSASNGNFDTQVYNRCKAVCDSQSQCLAFVGTENITPDGMLATSTCFFYSAKLISPRSCADSPSRIIAYYKGQTCPAVTTTSSTTKSSTSSSKVTTSSTSAKITTSSSSTTKSTTTASTTTSSSTTKSTTTTSTTPSTTPSTTAFTTTSSSCPAMPTPPIPCTSNYNNRGLTQTCYYGDVCGLPFAGCQAGLTACQCDNYAYNNGYAAVLYDGNECAVFGNCCGQK